MAFVAPADEIQSRGPSVNQFGDPLIGTSVPAPKQAQDLADAVISGLQNSATGLALRGKLPDQLLGENAPWYQRLGAGAGAIAADLPLSVAGAVAAAPAGPIASMAAAFAAPMALREALVTAYNNDQALSWAGVADIAWSALKGGTKGAVIGAATGGAGKLAAPLFAGGGKAAVALGTGGAELAALTATSAAVEQHMPTWQDFMDNALLLGGMKGAVHVAKGLRNVYAETGKTPAEVLADASKDPALKAQLESDPAALPTTYAPLALEQRIQAAINADQRPEALRQALTAPDAKLGERPPAVDWQYVTDGETARGVLNAVSEKYAKEIEVQRRGVVTNAASLADAEALIAKGETGRHKVGAAENSGQILVRAALLKDALTHAQAELAKIADIPEADLSPAIKLQALAALERVSVVNAEFAGARAEAGRALQIFQAVKRDSSMLGDAEALIKIAERKGNLQDVAKLVASLKDPAQLAEFAKGYNKATTGQQVMEAWKAAILSGPQTHLANIMGNLAKWGIEVPESVIAATFTAAQRAISGDPLSMAQFKARALAPIYGLQFGARDALTTAAEVIKGQGTHLEKADVYQKAIPGPAGEIVRLPFRALSAEDALFRTVVERAEAHIMAVDRAVKEGLDPRTAEYNQRVARLTEDPAFGLAEDAGVEAVKRVQQAGAEGVFSQRLGPRLEQVSRAIQGSWVEYIVPFRRTPVNLVSWAVQHVPGLNLMSSRWRADFAAGGERQARAVARVVIGTGLSVTAYTLAQDGLLTGGGQFDPEQRRTKNAAGWQPYSIKVGDKYYSYQRLEPVAKVLGLAGDLVELQAAMKDPEDKAKIASMMVLMFGNATVSTTYLSGISNAMNAVTDPQRYGGNFVEQYASSLVPKIVGQSVTAADPYKREVDGALDAIKSQLPYFREKLLPKRDVWGEPIKNDKWFAIMPISVTQESKDKVRLEAERLQVAIADAPKFLVEQGPFKATDKRVEYTPEQRDIYKQVAGKNAMTILSPIVNADDWKGIPDFAKASIFKAVIEGTRKQGQYAALPPDEAGRVQLRQKIVDKIIKQTQEAQSR